MLGGGQYGAGVGVAVDDRDHPELVCPPFLERERHVGEWQLLIASEFGGKRRLGVLQGLGGAG